MFEISAEWKSHLLVEYSKNKFACESMDGQVKDDRYKLVDNIICHKGRIYLVPESKFKERVLQAFHNSPLAGHQDIRGSSRLMDRLEKDLLRRASRRTLCATSGNVSHVNKTRMNTPTQQVYYSLFPFQSTNEKAYLWILLQDCPGHRGRIAFLCRWIT
jgi:hypothetical protein